MSDPVIKDKNVGCPMDYLVTYVYKHELFSVQAQLTVLGQ